MNNSIRSITISVPSTTANMGPGFDVLGAALDIRNEVTFYPGQSFQLRIFGEGSNTLPRTKENLIYRAYERVFLHLNKEPVEGAFIVKNRIPLSRGLGSSAAAVLLGAATAGTYLGLSRDELLDLILKIGEEFEGHPDNIIPAAYGGIRLCVKEKGQTSSFPVPVPSDVSILLVIPRKKISTAKARKIIGKKIDLTDAVKNMSHTALLIWMFDRNELSFWKEASKDYIHQDRRMRLVEGLSEVFSEIIASPLCLSGWLSGSGSTLAFAVKSSSLKEFEGYVIKLIERKKFNARVAPTKFSEKGIEISYE